LQLQQESNLPLVIYFYVDWCPYCRTLDRDYFSAPPVQNYLRRVIKVRINPEHGAAEREIANRYGLSGYPMFLVKRNSASTPVVIHPFRRGGNLTPAQFAQACNEIGPITGNAGVSVAESSQSGQNKNAARQNNVTSSGGQIVNVQPGAPAAPGFLEGPLPTLEQVLDRYAKAVGVKSSQEQITNRVAKGRLDVPGVGHGGRVESYTSANKSLTVMNVDSLGVVRHGFDGRIGWEQSDKAGLRASTGAGLAPIARDAGLYGNLKLRESYAKVKLLGKVKHGFREIYLVEATPRTGEADLLYFDVESGLLVRRDVTRQTARGPVRAEIYVSDWREVDGVKIPFKITQAMPGLTFVFTLEEVRHNVQLQDDIFRKPAS
jgi:hypothetical protein